MLGILCDLKGREGGMDILMGRVVLRKKGAEDLVCASIELVSG